MASIFQKADPKDGTIRRWMAKVKIGPDWKAISLRLLAVPGTKREATERANSLQAEILMGVLSARTRTWVGEETAARIEGEVGRSGRVASAGSPDTWAAAGEAWLLACNAKDSRPVSRGRVKAEEKTKVSRRYKLKAFLEWVAANRLPFLKESPTPVIARYIEHRTAIGIAPGTLWNADFTIVCTFCEWMASKGICGPVDRVVVREKMPARPPADVTIPTWRDDLTTLSHFHKIRDDAGWESVKGPGRSGLWKLVRSHQATWPLVLLVRGLGCRPSEATALSWETVDLAANKVRFVHSKNDRSRTVPVVLQWAQDGLAELWEARGRPRSGAVCVTHDGRIWKNDCSTANLIAGVCRFHKIPHIRLKEMEKLQIAQLIRIGFPPHVVAHWSDHTLTVQERHYFNGDSYLPPEDGYDFGDFGVLSEYGRRVLNHQGGYSRANAVD